MIRAVTFDLDGVYFLNGKHRFIEALAREGILPEKTKEVIFDSEQMKAYKRGDLTDAEFWTYVVNGLGITYGTEALIEKMIAGYEVDPHVRSIVRQVRDLGYRTLICSNNFPARIHGLQQKFHFLDDFDGAIFSYDVGVLKPAKEIFEALIEISGVAAHEIIYSDDKPERLEGAYQLGIDTFVYTGFDSFTDELRQRGIAI